MKDKSHTTITLGMTSPLSPGLASPLALDPFTDDRLNLYTNNNNSYNDLNMNDYDYNSATFPRSTATKKPKVDESKARLPVFKLLQVNRRKAEIIAAMPDG